MKLTLDFETRSRIDLKSSGVYRYAEDESTDVICLAIKVDGNEPKLWVAAKFQHLIPSEIGARELEEIISKADVIEAHNMNFERTLWREIMHKRYKYADIPLNKCRCSAALARYFALPGSLAGACEALNLPIQKDKVGYQAMLKICKPTSKGTWHEVKEDFEILAKYCKMDTNAEYGLSEFLGKLPEAEQKVWELDQIINDRGIPIAVEDVLKLKSIVEKEQKKLEMRVQVITKGQIQSTSQGKKALEWLADTHGVCLKDMQKATIEEALKKGNLPEEAKELLVIRQSLSKSSVAKLDAMLAYACKDNRARGTMMYHGATTGRFSGRGIQVQNLPRNSFSEIEVDNFLAETDEEFRGMLYGCPIQESSKCIRGMISSNDNLIAADFKSIEARVLAWIADEKEVLAAYFEGKDTYKLNAMKIYGCKYEEVTKEQRQIGKVCELALGYQGWTGAFQAMASTYGVHVKDEVAADIAGKWRENRVRTVALWKGIENAALTAIKTKSQVAYGIIKFGVKDNFLRCRLPSGRLLSYPFPSTMQITTKFGQDKEIIVFWGEDSLSGKWSEQKTYGGKLTENIVQAISRDILVAALLRLDKKYPVVMHVHDEIVSESKENDLQEFINVVNVLPDWAKGCPIDSEGWVGKRYHK